ncbi:hypothetical protein ABH942_001097 [Flavobacterium sp. 28YEA47A]|uniref:hypothetical protein n=1 Tax=Flavobacterium sp. 28YEA47A TaxID=3156276 RepID=UPI003517EB67
MSQETCLHCIDNAFAIEAIGLMLHGIIVSLRIFLFNHIAVTKDYSVFFLGYGTFINSLAMTKYQPSKINICL